ncbi:uncharacterized protein EV154DRAFT_403312, partial [Mucor mucedo]|uniref:uncharacterized protein n=1 Tax=Mucor mucedo TaxID=29922 RepID=UPI00221FEF48
KLFSFRGYEGEDFLAFKSNLEDYFSLKNITDDTYKITIFRTLLSGKARADLDNIYGYPPDNKDLKYAEVVRLVDNIYNTEEMKEAKKDAFNGINQLDNESPTNFWNRISEAAHVAGITSVATIRSRFKYGLLKAVREHCICTGAKSHEDYMRLAQGYW